MWRGLVRIVIAAALYGICAHTALAAGPQVERGKYLVIVAGCTDCHSPGALHGMPDNTRYLGGSDVGFAVPGEGVFVGRNLTPDKATGLGNWTDQQIIEALTKGVAYLKSLPPVHNEIPGPFGPNETPSSLVLTVLPGEVYAKLPKP
jgi:mono/diheme cytochrome c family protein